MGMGMNRFIYCSSVFENCGCGGDNDDNDDVDSNDGGDTASDIY